MNTQDNDIKNQQKSIRLYPRLTSNNNYSIWIQAGYIPIIRQLNRMRPPTLGIRSKLKSYEVYELSV